MKKISTENQDGKPRKVFDLVCNMELNIGDVRHAFEYNGKEYYFCSETCKSNFMNDPEKYVN